MAMYEFAVLRSTAVPEQFNIPSGHSRWHRLGPVNSQKVADGENVWLNATGLPMVGGHKYVPHADHSDGIKSYVHVNMVFPAILARMIPMNNAVLTVETSVCSGNPFASDRSKRNATILVTCTTMSGNIVYSGNFKDKPLKALHFKDQVLRAMVNAGKCSSNTYLAYVVGTKPLRGNAHVWKGGAKEVASKGSANRVIGGETKKKQLKMHSFTNK